ncbi:hypothetical protein [Paenarthrobacter sp.]|nr:hypothetical protein [Paenarthrobacter sp.]
MAHDEIKARTDLTPARVAMQDKLGTLQEISLAGFRASVSSRNQEL